MLLITVSYFNLNVENIIKVIKSKFDYGFSKTGGLLKLISVFKLNVL